MHPMGYRYEDLRAFIKRLEKEGERNMVRPWNSFAVW